MSRRLARWVAPIAVCCWLGGVGGVRITRLDVPAVALEGDQVHLRCDYENESDSSLYSLMWYKEEMEFFRLRPGGGPDSPDRCPDNLYFFPVTGVSVDCWSSTERDVVLQGVTRATSGDYQCTVIGEKPSFRRESRKARLTVFSEALKQPVVAGVLETYAPLDTVTLTCSPTNTQYLPLLSWRLNGDPVPTSYLIKYADRRALGLRFVARPDHFQRGLITATCIASFGSTHMQAAEVTLLSDDYSSTNGFYPDGGEAMCGSVQTTAVLMAACVLFHHFIY